MPGGRGKVFSDPGRYQGSLIGYQKRQIADSLAVMVKQWKELHGTRPLVFCLTSPVPGRLADQPKFLKKFLDTMRKNYGMRYYTWVREYTKKGTTHFHFVALVKRFDFVQASLLWSGYFGSQAKNSVRVGIYKGNQRVGLYLKNDRMAWYMSKYFGKGFQDMLQELQGEGRKRLPRKFGISDALGKISAPLSLESVHKVEYQDKRIFTVKGWQTYPWPVSRRRAWVDPETGEEIQGIEQRLKSYSWKYAGKGSTFIGVNFKKSKKKPEKSRK